MNKSKKKHFSNESKGLKSFYGLEKFSEYESLSFSYNPIVSFFGFPRLTNLKSLILDFTSIDTLEFSCILPSLVRISLKNTPFASRSCADLMCCIAFGPTLQYYNDIRISNDILLHSNIWRDKIRKYIVNGWVITNPNPLKLLEPKSRRRFSLFSNSNKNSSHEIEENTEIEEDISKESPNSEFQLMLFNDLMSLTDEWNHIDPGKKKPISYEQRKKQDLLIQGHIPSIIGLRKTVRNNTGSYDDMMSKESKQLPSPPISRALSPIVHKRKENDAITPTIERFRLSHRSIPNESQTSFGSSINEEESLESIPSPLDLKASSKSRLFLENLNNSQTNLKIDAISDLEGTKHRIDELESMLNSSKALKKLQSNTPENSMMLSQSPNNRKHFKSHDVFDRKTVPTAGLIQPPMYMESKPE